MLNSINVSDLQENAQTWFFTHVWTISTLTQLSIVIASLLLGALAARMAAAPLIAQINKLNVPVGIKQVLHNLRHLILPLVALIILFIAGLVDALGFVPGGSDILGAAISLLIAWLVIRLAVQFISNNFIRNVFALTIWLIAALSILGVLDDTSAALDTLGINIGGFRLSVLTVFKASFLLFLLLYMASFISSLAERQIKQISGLTPSSKVLISKIVKVTLITFALLIGITSAGIDLSLLAVFSGALGLGVGFGLQKGVSNLFSGMMLLMDKSIKPGDIIEVQDKSGLSTFGWVNQMGARYTEIITRDNKSYLIPNEDFITQQVVNWSHGDTLIRIDVKFGVHYESDPHLVKKLAEEAARKPHRVVQDPAPVCHLMEFGDSALNFSLRFWIKDAEKGISNMRGDVMLALWDVFKENNIQIPYPQMDVHVVEMPAGKSGNSG